MLIRTYKGMLIRTYKGMLMAFFPKYLVYACRLQSISSQTGHCRTGRDGYTHDSIRG